MGILRTSLAVTVAAVVLAGVSPADAAKRKAKPSCAKKGSKTVRSSRDARLFTVSGRDAAEHLYGCLRSVGRPVELTEETDDIDASSDFDDVRLSGRYAAWRETSTSNDDSCRADCPSSGFDGTTESVSVYDLRRRRTVRRVSAGVTDHALVLTRRGAVAWLSGTDVFAADRSGRRRLDTGATGPRSLRAEISVVSWVRDGVERFARLGPAR
jgi:hypothetical protein